MGLNRYFARKAFIFSVLFLAGISPVRSADYSRVDEQSAFVPPQYTRAVDIARYLTRNLFTPEDKIRALFYWTATNIRFDVNQIPGDDYRFHVTSAHRDFVREAIDGRKGVCQHYAVLFDSLCHSIGIKSWIVAGYTFNNNKLSDLSHAWNLVLINGKFLNLDVSWSAGYVEDGKFQQRFTNDYYLVDPEKFIHTHIPFDPVWQCSDYPRSHTGLMADKTDDHGGQIFAFNDSINRMEMRDTLTNLICEYQRICQAGIANKVIEQYAAYLQRNISIFEYNSIINYLNAAIFSYNTYTSYRNTQYRKGTIPDNQIAGLLLSVRQNLTKSMEAFAKLSSTRSGYTRIQHSIDHLSQNLAEEESFFKLYQQTANEKRMLLFLDANE